MKDKLKKGLIIAAIAVALIHLINYLINLAASVKNLLSDEKGSYFSWRCGEVYYKKSGSGSPLLLIHDLSPSSSSYEWNSIVEKLSKKHTVYCLELPGCGRSEKPDFTYTNYFYVQLLNDFVSQVIKEKANVAATGLSGSVVMMANLNNPDLFDKIVMINPEDIEKLCQIPSAWSRFVKFLINMPIIGTGIYNLHMNRENIEYQFTENYFYNPFLVKKKMLHVYYESAHKDDSHGKYLLASLYGGYINANITKALKEASNDLIIIEGTHFSRGKDIVKDYIKLNPDIHTLFIKDTKRYPHMENPELILKHFDDLFD